MTEFIYACTDDPRWKTPRKLLDLGEVFDDDEKQWKKWTPINSGTLKVNDKVEFLATRNKWVELTIVNCSTDESPMFRVKDNEGDEMDIDLGNEDVYLKKPGSKVRFNMDRFFFDGELNHKARGRSKKIRENDKKSPLVEYTKEENDLLKNLQKVVRSAHQDGGNESKDDCEDDSDVFSDTLPDEAFDKISDEALGTSPDVEMTDSDDDFSDTLPDEAFDKISDEALGTSPVVEMTDSDDFSDILSDEALDKNSDQS